LAHFQYRKFIVIFLLPKQKATLAESDFG